MFTCKRCNHNGTQNDNLNTFLGNSNIPKLSEEQKASCEGRISNIRRNVNKHQNLSRQIRLQEMMDCRSNFTKRFGVV